MEVQENPQLYKIRHSMAHVMAQAVKSLFPDAKLGFGPPTEHGFFYDFDLLRAGLHIPMNGFKLRPLLGIKGH